MADEITIRRLAQRAGVSASELVATAGRTGFADSLEIPLEGRVDELLDAAETADHRADRAQDTATLLFHAQAEELRTLAVLYLRRMAAGQEAS
jgi:hypothetical protein